MSEFVVYDVLIDNGAGTFTGTAGTDDYGFADFYDVPAYLRAGSAVPDYDTAYAKELSHARWRRILDRVSTLASPVHLLEASNGTGDISTVPDQLRFEVGFRGPDEPVYEDPLGGPDLVGTAAVRRLVAEGLAYDFDHRLFVADGWLTPSRAYEVVDVRVLTPLSGTESVRISTAEAQITVTRLVP